jgi:hypothetical protein
MNLPLVVDLEQKVGELVLSTTSYPTITILENALKCIIEKMRLW